MAACPVWLLDGGLGTALQDRYGVPFAAATTPLWSSHLLVDDAQAAVLRRCQADFARAGADVLETATYQVSAAGLARTGVAGADVDAFLARAVDIAEGAIADAIRPGDGSGPAGSPGIGIALSLGPYGACMVPSTEYSGAYDAAASDTASLRRWHAARLRLFDRVPRLADRVRFLAFETVPRLDEISAVRQLYVPASAGDIDPALARLPYWISCVFPGTRDALPDGTAVADAVRAMLAPVDGGRPPWGIGINCTKIGRLAALVAQYEAAVRALAAASTLLSRPALVLYPDGTNGEIYNTTTQKWELPAGAAPPVVPWETQLSAIVRAAAASGCWSEILVGGCCKATDQDICALRAALNEA